MIANTFLTCIKAAIFGILLWSLSFIIRIHISLPKKDFIYISWKLFHSYSLILLRFLHRPCSQIEYFTSSFSSYCRLSADRRLEDRNTWLRLGKNLRQNICWLKQRIMIQKNMIVWKVKSIVYCSFAENQFYISIYLAAL